MSVLEQVQGAFLEQYSNYPMGRYVSIVVVRQVLSEAIFRTEGSGEPLNREFVHAGQAADSPVIQRVVISKRKQTAVERRTGRELLREFGLLFESTSGKKAGQICGLNRNNPCGRCMDCMIYGFAVGQEGAQKSRVVTDDAFSLHAAHTVTDRRQWNALYDNSTMRDPESNEPSHSIGTDEYVKPETLFLDIETLRDLTPAEFIYAFGNILRSSRYGAVSSRIGKMKNHIAAVVFSDCEVFSNLELTQFAFDALHGGDEEPPFPLAPQDVLAAVYQTVQTLSATVPGRLQVLSVEDTAGLVDEVTTIYQDESQLRRILETASTAYPKG